MVSQLSVPVAGVAVSAMVPSHDRRRPPGVPFLPGILYGDKRTRFEASGATAGMPDARGFLRWAAETAPSAAGYWPCQAVATYALCGVPAMDSVTSIVYGDLRGPEGWRPEALAALGVRPDQMPVVVEMGEPAGTNPETGAVVTGGTIDALCDQLVSVAAEPGDVLAIFGATLVIWIVTDRWVEIPGLVTVPHTVPDRILVGGPSNAGALFADWARHLLRGVAAPGPARGRQPAPTDGRTGDPERVPVWLPYLRGERTPFNDPSLRASLHGLDITQGPAAVERAAYRGERLRHPQDARAVGARGAAGGDQRRRNPSRGLDGGRGRRHGAPGRHLGRARGRGPGRAPSWPGWRPGSSRRSTTRGAGPAPGARVEPGPGVGEGGRRPLPALRGAGTGQLSPGRQPALGSKATLMAPLSPGTARERRAPRQSSSVKRWVSIAEMSMRPSATRSR